MSKHLEFVHLLQERLKKIKAKPAQTSYQHPDFMSIRCWSRKRFSNYSGIVLVELGGPVEFPKTAVQMSAPIGKDIGYTPFFAPLGMSMIFTCEGGMPPEAKLKAGLDQINTMEVIRQHITFIDLRAMEFVQVRAFGSFLAGKVPNLIRQAAEDFCRQ